MTHDPFCQLGTSKAHTNPEDCHSCAFIAKVRADTLDKAEAEIDYWRNDDDPEEYIKGNIDAIGAIRSLRNAL